MKGLSKLTRIGALALIVTVAAVSWFAHRGNAFTLVEVGPQQLSNLVSLTASQGIRANVFNQSDQPVSATIKFWDANGNTIGTQVDIELEPLHGLSIPLAPTSSAGAAVIPFAAGGAALVRASITVSGANADKEKANLNALVAHIEVFDTGDGSVRFAVPLFSVSSGGDHRHQGQ
jgi:hypothetical protein